MAATARMICVLWMIRRCKADTIEAMSRFGSQYQVARPTGKCAHSGETLEPGTPYIAALCDASEGEGFERVDYSIEAWESGVRPAGLFSFWKSTVPDPEEKQNLLVDDAVLLELFERLDSDDRQQRVAFRFVLGLILMRKKQLKLVGRVDAEGELPQRWLLQVRGSEGPPLELINPQLTDDDVRELTEQLSEILQGEL